MLRRASLIVPKGFKYKKYYNESFRDPYGSKDEATKIYAQHLDKYEKSLITRPEEEIVYNYALLSRSIEKYGKNVFDNFRFIQMQLFHYDHYLYNELIDNGKSLAKGYSNLWYYIDEEKNVNLFKCKTLGRI